MTIAVKKVQTQAMHFDVFCPNLGNLHINVNYSLYCQVL